MSEALLKHIEEQKKAFEEFKKENDKNRPDPAVIAKISATLDSFEAKNQQVALAHAAELKARDERIDELEKKLNRMAIGDIRPANDAAERKAAFLSYCRKGADRVTQAEAKALTQSDDTAGGYLSPIEYIQEIIKGEVLFSPMRSLVRVRTTGRQSIGQPKRTRTAAARWVGETESRNETQNAAYGFETIPAHEMTAECYASFADLEDSLFDIEGEIREEFAEQFGVTEGAAIVGGNGKNKPAGLLDASAGIAYTPSGTSAGIADANGVADGIVELFHAVKTAYASRGTWLLNRKTLGEVRKLKDGNKRYLWEPSPAVGSPSLILGAPYVEVPDMPDLAANAFPIGFGDWRRCYTAVDRLSLSIVRDPYTKASEGQVKFVGRRRFGGQVVLAEAARFLKCATS